MAGKKLSALSAYLTQAAKAEPLSQLLIDDKTQDSNIRDNDATGRERRRVTTLLYFLALFLIQSILGVSISTSIINDHKITQNKTSIAKLQIISLHK